MSEVNIGTIFLTGLLTGGLTCLAVQGGLLASSLAQQTEKELSDNSVGTNTLIPISVFLVSKLIAYTILGFLLGALGEIISPSLTVRTAMQFLVVVFMLGTAANMLQLHPIFRRFVIQPPRFVTKLVRKQSKSASFFAPAFLGALTIFIPCGTTQAMMALSLATANPLLGALVLFVFTISTSPVFLLFGFLAHRMQSSFNARFSRVVAALLIILALYNLDGALSLASSPVTIKSVVREVYCTISWCTAPEATLGAPKSTQTITIERDRYTPAVFSVKKGEHIKLNVVNKNGGGCIQAFTIPSLNIEKIVPIGQTEVIEFTAPEKAGTVPFMCSMGMFNGVINVI